MRTAALLYFLIASVCSIAQQNFTGYIKEAAMHLEEADYKKSISSLDKAIANKNSAPNQYALAEAYVLRGICESNLGQYKSGIADIDRALELKPEYQKAHLARCEILTSAGKHEECVSWADTALKFQPGNKAVLLKKGRSQRILKRYDEALLTLNEILADDPHNVGALIETSAVKMAKKEWKAAVEGFDKVLAIAPDNPEALFDRGISRSYVSDTAGAKADIQRAMILDTAAAYVGYNNIGFFLKLEQGDYAGSIPYFDKCIALKPKFSFAYSNRGFARLQLKDMTGARTDLDKAISLDKENSYAYKNLGLYFKAKGDCKTACRQWQKAKDLNYAERYDNEVEELLKGNCPCGL